MCHGEGGGNDICAVCVSEATSSPSRHPIINEQFLGLIPIKEKSDTDTIHPKCLMAVPCDTINEHLSINSRSVNFLQNH